MSLYKKPRRRDAMRAVLAFTFRHWAKQPRYVALIALAMSGATLTEIFVPVVAGKLIDALVQNGRDSILMLFAAMAGLGLGMLILRHLAWMSVITFTLRIMSDVACEAFHRVQRFSTDWQDNTFAGSTVRKITRGMWAIDMLNDTILLMLTPSAVVLIGTMVLLAIQAPLLGVVMGVGAALYVTLTVTLAMRLVAPAASLSNTWDTRMSGSPADAISSNAVVKAFGAESREEAGFARVIDKWRRRTDRTWTLGTWSGTTQILVLWLVRLGLIAAALYLWFQGKASPGDVAYVLTSYFIMHGYLRDIGQHVQHLQRSANDMEEMVAMFDQPLGIEDRAAAVPAHLTAGEVKFDHVTFRYGGHQTALFNDLSVLIKGGARVGLVGHSGSGKTTFVKLIQRLYDVTEGCVLVDGQDVRGVTQQSLRAQIAIVQQEPILFHRSLAENIAYARPGATRAEIEHAATLANAHDFILRLPKAYETLVGERGVKLSDGQRQRIALARVILKNAPILVLDEATSGLDSDVEAAIQEQLSSLMVGRKVIAIAHRLSTIAQMDRLIVMDQGRIVEIGSHDALLAANGTYARLWKRQSGGFQTGTIRLSAE